MTAITTTLPEPSSVRRGPALLAGLAFLVAGAVMGATGTAIVSDTDDAPARVATSTAGTFDHGYIYAHGFSYAPETHGSADAAERWALSEESSPDSCHDIVRGVC